MRLSISPTDQDVFLALWSFLTSILPNGNAVLTGSLAGDTLTVSQVTEGGISLGDAVLGTNVDPATTIVGYGPNTSGMAGTYIVDPPTAFDVASSTLSTFVDVLQAQGNRVPEPLAEDYVTMTVLRLPRLATNLDDYFDLTFTGSIADQILTVTSVEHGTNLEKGSPVFSVDVEDGTTILALGTGNGGPGTYYVGPKQNVASQPMAAGIRAMTQAVQLVIQLDVHGPNAANSAQVISTAFRSGVATEFFAAFNPAISPLFADDLKQMPFVNSEQQVENRYVVEANLQVNQTVTVRQQFAADVKVGFVAVDEFIPAPVPPPTPPSPSTDPSLDFSIEDDSMYQPGL